MWKFTLIFFIAESWIRNGWFASCPGSLFVVKSWRPSFTYKWSFKFILSCTFVKLLVKLDDNYSFLNFDTTLVLILLLTSLHLNWLKKIVGLYTLFSISYRPCFIGFYTLLSIVYYLVFDISNHSCYFV